MYQQVFREKRDQDKELGQTVTALKQSIEAVRKQNRDLRLEKNQSLEQRPVSMEMDGS